MKPPALLNVLSAQQSKLLKSRYGSVYLALVVFVAISLLTRIGLLVSSVELVSWDISLPAAFLVGILFDLGAASFVALPLVVLLAVLPGRFFAYRWTKPLVAVAVAVAIFAVFFGGVAEWFFWDEFGARFNFIAVDYLVYTTEVLGNIRESYPLPWIIVGVGTLSLLSSYALLRSALFQDWMAHSEALGWRRLRAGGIWFAVLLGFGVLLNENQVPDFSNNYNKELAKNGLWSLFAAFRANQLDYERFYPTMPTEAAFNRVRTELLARDNAISLTKDPRDLLRLVPATDRTAPEKELNVIQITVESLSSEFLTRYGSADKLTPVLDDLMSRSLVFDRFYATGNRTDRGMEALTLSVPPTPGRSLVKRPHNEGLFTLGSVFRMRGYDTAFIYGGYGYFDNMNYFFGENGYRVIDRGSAQKDDITFANAWGACDEDVFRWTLREADRVHDQHKPFHFFVMTTSNHRPYTYPEGRIDLPPKVSGRAGAVKYSDYAIGQLLLEASKRPWYKNTVFVIVADHCASSAGRRELPVERYHIPLIVFSPGGQLPTGAVGMLTSQVDYAPTLLGLLNWSYPSRFFGRNVVAANVDEASGRAFIANYQKLGYLVDGELAILGPVKESQVRPFQEKAERYRSASRDSVLEAIASYQTASWLFKQHKQLETAPTELDSFRLVQKLERKALITP